MFESRGKHRWGCSGVILAVVLGAGARHTWAGTVHLQLRPALVQAACGETVDLDLYAISADGVNDPVPSIAVIFLHDPAHLEPVGLIATSPYPWLAQLFPNDVMIDRINNDLADGEFCTEQSCAGPQDCSALGCPPQCGGACSYSGLPYNDGTTYVNWIAQFINPPGFFQATPGPTGALVGTIRFRVIANGSSQVTIPLASGANTVTAVYDGVVPGLNILGLILAPLPTIATKCCTSDDCNDGIPCTNDVCTPSGTCDNPSNCTDGHFCNGIESCNQQLGQCEPGTPPVCPGTTVCAHGVCNPNADGGAGACVIVNKPNFSLCADDGNDCTVNECLLGACTSIPLPGCVQFLEATVQLSPPVVPAAFDRCICFDLVSSCTPPVSTRVCTEMTFGPPKNLTGQAQAVIRVPAEYYVCVSAFDPLHTVVSTDFTPFLADDTLSASFTGDVAFGGNWLTHGNVDGSCEIDNADASAVTALLGTDYGSGSTMCSTPAPHADLNGDGVVDSVDENSVTANAKTSGTGCCEEPPTVCNGDCAVGSDCGTPDDCNEIACINGICVLNPAPAGTPCFLDPNPGDPDCNEPDTCDGAGGCNLNWQYGPCTEDGNPCTKDVCTDGQCSHPAWPDGSACFVGGAKSDPECDQQDTCVGGVCLENIVADGTPCTADENDCTDDVCQGGACAHLHDDANACDDGDGCTIDDNCSDETCAGTFQCRLYGDVTAKFCVVDVDDILYVLYGFVDPPGFPDADLEPCGGDADVDVDDIQASMNAFIGFAACPDPCGP